MDGMDKFYLEGPMCSVAMWSCMERIQTTRQTCEDKVRLKNNVVASYAFVFFFLLRAYIIEL